MTDEIPERYQDQFVTIRKRQGKFTLNKPDMVTTVVLVVIPEYDFKHEFTFSESWGDDYRGLASEPWPEAIYTIANSNPKYIGDREPRERLQEIYDEHNEELWDEWEQYRVDKIDEKIESLQDEKQRLQ